MAISAYHIKDKTVVQYKLRQTTAAKDLGVLLEKLNFSKHIDNNVMLNRSHNTDQETRKAWN